MNFTCSDQHDLLRKADLYEAARMEYGQVLRDYAIQQTPTCNGGNLCSRCHPRPPEPQFP